ncbi:MAG: C25 family cysteine peptidase [Planctomycetota bacterium]
MLSSFSTVRSLSRKPLLRAALLAVALVPALLAPTAGAQDPTWVPLVAGAAPGTPAEIVLDQAASNASDSFFDVWVSGFWSETITPGDGNTYTRIEVPGLSRHGQIGAPDLPQAVLRLAVVTSAPRLSVVAVNDLDPRSFAGLLLAPFEEPELDGAEDIDGTPASYLPDPLIYSGTAAWPAALAPSSAPITPRLGTIPSAEVAVSLGRWNPVTGELALSAHTRVHLQAPAAPIVFPAITKERAALAAQTFHNWTEQLASFPSNPTQFQGRYLIVLKENALPYVESFVEHKSLQGFAVELLFLESLPFVGCGELRAAIGDWYAAGNPAADHYALLLGDDLTLPLCSSLTLNSKLGDDLYGSPLDGDLDEEIFVGRLTYDSVHFDLEHQLDRIRAYELDTQGTHYGSALLAANLEDAPGKYVGNCAAVVSASYAFPPDFTVLNGNELGSTDAVVVSAIDAGLGLVTYRGHGSSSAWSKWNLSDDNFNQDDLDLLTSSGPRSVAWSFSCWNNRIDTEDCLGENWMEDFGVGPVAHYGSTDISGTKQNHRLNLAMHAAIFDLGLLRHGHAIAWSEQRMASEEPGVNSWMYLLLGDPSMRVRRTQATLLKFALPDAVPSDGSGTGAPWVVTITNESGTPQADVLVAIYKPGTSTGGPALSANAYTNALGQAAFTVFPTDIASAIEVGASDASGQMAVATIGTSSGAWTNFGGGLAGSAGKPVLIGTGPLTADSAVSLELSQAPANALGLLFGSVGSQPVPFKGGLLVAAPWALLAPIASDALGEVLLGGRWPAGLPADLELWFQVALQDPAARAGVSLSNGLRAISP